MLAFLMVQMHCSPYRHAYHNTMEQVSLCGLLLIACASASGVWVKDESYGTLTGIHLAVFLFALFMIIALGIPLFVQCLRSSSKHLTQTDSDVRLHAAANDQHSPLPSSPPSASHHL